MLILYIITVLLGVVVQGKQECCLQIRARSCLNCPLGTHLYRGNCLIDVDYCLAYKDGFECATCQAGYQLNIAGECSLVPASFNDEIVDAWTLTAVVPQPYTRSLEYWKKSKSQQLANAWPIGALIRTYSNTTTEVTIQFQDLTKFYRGVTIADLPTSPVREISFATVANSTVLPGLVISSIDPKNPGHLERLAPVEAEARKQNIGISLIDTGKLTTYSNGSYEVNATYKGASASDRISILAAVSQEKKVSILQTKLIKLIQQNNSDPVSLAYSTFDVNSTDDYYLVALDFLANQVPKYSDLQPIKAQRAQSPPIIGFKLMYLLADGSNWEANLIFNNNTYILTLISENLITPPSKPASAAFEKLDPATIFTDFRFILVAQYINNQSSNKFKDATIAAIEREDQTTIIKYRISYQVGGSLLDVLAQIDKPSLTASGYQESRKDDQKNASPAFVLNPKIQGLVVGLTELPAAEANGADFKSIDALVRSVNSKQLAGADFAKAYYSEQSFTRNYKIYYQRGLVDLYEARVARENLRKRNYMLGFTRIP